MTMRRAHSARREQFDERALLTAASTDVSGEALLDEKRARRVLDRVLDGMPDDLRTAFVLFEIEGFSLRELAELCDIPLGTVSSRLRRAREAFHEGAQRMRRSWHPSGGPRD